MNYTFRPRGVCSQLFNFEIEDGRIVSLKVTGGCDGNLKGISRLITGMRVDDVISQLGGIRCGWKDTSCPDQISRALKQFKAENS